MVRLLPIALVALLAGCSREGLVAEGGVYTVRSVCPHVAVLGAAGDITLFTAPNRTDAGALDVTAAITNVRGTCQETGEEVISTVTFDVVGQRRDAGAARQVVLPYFSAAIRGGNEVAAKRVGYVALNFDAGAQRAQTSSQATVRVHRSATALPDNVREILTRRRRPGDVDAAVDPLSDPGVRAAVAQATFEHLVGFQLTDAQLRYNATR